MKRNLLIFLCLALNGTIIGQKEPELKTADGEHQWAVLICGNEIGDGDVQRFWFDLSSVYTVLANVCGYQESEVFDFQNRRIIVLAPWQIRDMYKDEFFYNTTSDLNGNESYNGDFFYCDDNEGLTLHTKENIHNVFKCFAGDAQCEADYRQFGLRKLTEDDQLFIFMTGHGHREESNDASYFIVNEDAGGEKPSVYDFEFAEWLRDINCGQMVLVSQICYAGGFVEKFMSEIALSQCQNRVAQSATTAEAVSHAEMHCVYSSFPSDLNKNYVDEFTYYWTASLLGYYPKYRFSDGYNGTIVDEGPWTDSGRGIGDGSMNWETYFGSFEASHPHALYYDVDPDTDGDNFVSYEEMFNFANNLDTWSRQGYYHPNKNDTLYVGFQPEEPMHFNEDLTVVNDNAVGFAEISVSPNPVKSVVRIEGMNVAEINAYNSLGQWVMGHKQSNEIDLGSLPKGVYELRITGKEGERSVRRVVKE